MVFAFAMAAKLLAARAVEVEGSGVEKDQINLGE